MASDFFHDFARAYYGISPELYQLASIATGGGAPEDYTCSASKYSGEEQASKPPVDEKMLDPNNHMYAAKKIGARSVIASHGRLNATFPTEQQARDFHSWAAGRHGLDAGIYSPELGSGSDEWHVDFMPNGLTWRSGLGKHPHANINWYQGDESSYDDPDNWSVNPMDATSEQVEYDHEALRRSADEEDYGIMDAAKKAARSVALGTGIAASCLGGGCSQSQPATTSPESVSPPAAASDSQGFTDDAKKNVQTRLKIARDNMARMKVRQATGGGPGVGVSAEAPKTNYAMTGSGTCIQPEKNCSSAKYDLPSTEAQKGGVTPAKARQILRDGEVHGHPLTEAQRRMFGAIAGTKK